MKHWRPLTWLLLSVACFIAAYYFWELGNKREAERSKATGTNVTASPKQSSRAPAAPTQLTSSVVERKSTAPVIPPLNAETNSPVRRSTNFPYRLSNTTQGIGELVHNSKAILLENALIDSSKPLALAIPDKLRAQGDPGSYIVQANGTINKAFRAQLQAAGLTIVSYIPNNAYLVLGTAAQVAPFGTSAIPWQPYYKIKPALMPSALAGVGAPVNVSVYPGTLPATTAALKKMGVTIASQSPSPFGTELSLQNANDLAAIASLNGVMEVEPSSARMIENDLSRVIESVSSDVFVPANYLNLTGSNVLVAVNDSWVPTNSGSFNPAVTINPDLTNIIGLASIFPAGIGIADLEGHATHVGGIIASSGDNSPTNAIGSQLGANFRGKAPLATLFAMPALSGLTDAQLQEAAAQTNALISNNSWGYGDSSYDLAASSYDQAVRDSIPGMTGSQSLIYVFAAGNNGGGDLNGDGFGGQADSLSSPGVAKNVVSVGASMLPRNITNSVYACDLCNTNNGCVTNQPWLANTSSSNLVTDFSSRGNVGIGAEGQFGRFKPDVVAPGASVVSTRSLTWDTNAYYNPVSHNVIELDNNEVDTNTIFTFFGFFVPCSAVQMTITAVPVTPQNVQLPIYVSSVNDPVQPSDLLGTNTVSLPPDKALSPTDQQWFVGVGNPTNEPVVFNLIVDIVTTNSLGDYFQVLEGLNDQLFSTNSPPIFYRYESGTSMSAGSVSGVLALMEDYFTNQVHYTPSPALMKALLINGARSINSQYDFEVQNSINYQGWGLINLTNSLPVGITNLNSASVSAPMIYIDQSPTNALTTGDSQTYTLTVTNVAAQQSPMRVTLVWTDPPGNPAASLKLVNNLDLIITNNDNPTNPVVYFGNDFLAQDIFSSPWDGDTNNIPYDTINNVQNVYIPATLGTNYTITVFAKDVNVNAITATTNEIAQDYALVVSSDDGEINNAFTLAYSPIVPKYMPDVTDVTNQIDEPTASGSILLNQLVGANPPQATNMTGLTNQDNWGTNGEIKLGVPNQWHFYVITNIQGTNALGPFTNAAFLTFLPPDLSIPPVGVNAPDLMDATRPEADIDLYVARGPNAYNLTNLDPTVVAAADKSLGRGGTEIIVYSNAQPDEVFYIGVQSQDQEAALYAFAGLFSLNPFSTMSNGVELVQGINVPTPIGAATSTQPSGSLTLGLAVQPIEIRRAVVTNHIEEQNFGDLVGTLAHNGISAVLNNHTFGNGGTNQILIYEDNGEGTIAGSQPSDGPGSLRSYIGQQGIGLWTLTESNSSIFSTGQVDAVSIRLEPQSQGNNGVTATIPPNSFFFDFIDVPAEATNLTICVGDDPAQPSLFNQPVELFVRYGELPTLTQFDYMQFINPPGSCLSIDRTSLPPLRPGRYYVGIYNPNGTPQTIHLSWTLGLDVNGVNPGIIVSTNVPAPLLEDAVTNSSIFITNQQNIVSVNVGVVMTDPRISDLDLTLVSPAGQRILLMENRGGPGATNVGHLNITTNIFGQVTSGGANANTNVISPVPNQGVLVVNYNMFTVPDQMDVYYNGVDIFHSGYVAGPGTFTIPYGPGPTNAISIVMNQGNNPVDSTLWVYTPFVVSEDYTYLTFTDDTNLTDIPIKYAIPPFDNLDNGTNIFLADFDLATNGNYIATPNSPSNGITDVSGGWILTTNDVFVLPTNYYTGTNLISMATNRVSVFSDPFTGFNGSNILALANGSISRVLSLTPERNYTINYFYRGPGIGGWWRGEGNASDSADPETLGNNGYLIGSLNFPAGEVGQAFALENSGSAFEFAGTNSYVQVRQSPSLDVASNSSGFTVEGWINPTNTTFQQPIAEWLAGVPMSSNSIMGKINPRFFTNFNIVAGPFLNTANDHYYYLLGQTNWTTSEIWAQALGGHLVEVDDANEENWIYDTFARWGLTNHTMWIGLTNASLGGANFIWSTGNSSLVYTNWAANEPTNCGAGGYVAILGPTNALPGLWVSLDNNGVNCTGVTNAPFGVVEVDQLQTNGVQLWISVTNSVTNNVLTGLGRLYANIMDTNNVPHEIFSAPGLIQSNVFQHIALTYNTNTGVAKLYYQGTNVATTNLGVFVPNTTGDLLLGKDLNTESNNFYWGLMDEMSVYSRYLSDAEIAAIYNISASTTNRSIGKFNPAVTPALSLAEAQAVFGNVTNLLFGVNGSWQAAGFSFKSTSNTLPVQITGLEPGVLLDSFSISEQPPGNLYYLPEQALNALVGSNAFGNWTLEIRDSRTGLIATNAQLISWELQFVLQTNTPTPIELSPQTPGTNTIPPGEVGYFVVNVPDWANDATNILVSSTSPVSLLFNQTAPPESGVGNDFTFVNNNTAGATTMSAIPPSIPPLLPGQSYYLAVTNAGGAPATVVVEVDFNITTLTNGLPYTASFKTNDIERPFIFNVSSNATEATFQLMQLTGNADLVLRRGLPIPSLTSADYGSFSGSNSDETIYVLTNSAPVNLTAGPWYLDVIKRVGLSDAGITGAKMRYAVLAKELDPQVSRPVPTIIDLTNRVPFTWSAGPGAALTNFFRFGTNNFTSVVPTNIGIHFELYNQSGNGDLTVQTDAPPLAPQFFQSSRLPGNGAEFIDIQTNPVTLTNLQLHAWYLGVPNNETNPITYTIIGVIDTNAVVAFPTAEGAGSITRGGTFGTNVYHVVNTDDSGPGSLRAAVTATNGAATVVFDVAGTIVLHSPLLITNSFLTVAGQTAPNPGITIDGAPTVVDGVTDIVLRYMRFRPHGADAGDSLQLTNVQNVIVDHISAAFGTNNIISVLNSSNVTVQWSVLADSLNQTNALTGGSEVRYGAGEVTLHHNLYVNNYSASPRIGDDITLDFVNNVIFNWGAFAGLSTNDNLDNPGGFTNYLNYAANYAIAWTNSIFTNVAFYGGSTNTWIFQTDNVIDTNLNFILDGADTSWGMFSNQFTEFSAPFIINPTAPDKAFIAYEKVLDFAGTALGLRDGMDRGIVQEARFEQANTNATTAMLSGMVAWWKAENNFLDSTIYGNNGTPQGDQGFAPGEVGTAFNFTDGTQGVRVDGSPSLAVSNITIEGWIYPTYVADYSPVLEYGSDTNFELSPIQIEIGWSEFGTLSGGLFSIFRTGPGSSFQMNSPANLVPTNQWSHVAVTFDYASQTANMYFDGNFVSSTTYPGPGKWNPATNMAVYIGYRSSTSGEARAGTRFQGELDEFSIYNRALSPCEILAIYNSGTNGKAPLLAGTNSNLVFSPNPPFKDADQDGIPDFWEITLGENPTNFSATADRDGDGDTDLEEYLNWLGAPHALTVTNNPVAVDLYALAGETGNLTFGVANGTNGTVYLTNGATCSPLGGNIAIFTPTNNFGGGSNGGFGSFTFMVTNLDTVAYFGPVTVSVFASSVPVTNANVAPFIFTNPPDITMLEGTTATVTNTAVPTNGITYMLLNPPTWAAIDTNTGVITLTPGACDATNITIFTVATDTNVPPDSLTNQFNVTVLNTNFPPIFLVTNLPNVTNNDLRTIVVTNTAIDTNCPLNPLGYQVCIAPYPPGTACVGNANINNNGVITWTPDLTQQGLFLVTTIVTNYDPYAANATSLSATNQFYIFVTAPLGPFAFTQPAQAVTGASAQLNGMATPNGLASMAWFEWGTNTSYGNQTPPVSVGSGFSVVYTSNQIGALTINVPYHYRLVVSNALAVVHGFDQILDEAYVVGWGADYLGQIDIPPGLSNAVAIAGAYDHSLALRNNETVLGWGDNTFNQTNVPAGLTNALAIAGGQYYSMALTNGGSVISWGADPGGRYTNVPPGLGNVVMIAGGTYASFALQSVGTVVAWGGNFFSVTNPPIGLSNIVEVAGGSYHAVAIRNDGTLVAWGDNSSDQTTIPATATNVVQIACGDFHSVALRGDGTVVSWGDNSSGQTNVPAGLSNVVAVAAGGFHSLALKSDGSIVGWGDNSSGQISVPLGLTNVVAISAGYFHNLALTPVPFFNSTNLIILPTTNGVPETNTVLGGKTVFYQVNVPGNVDFDTNTLIPVTGQNLNVWFTTNTPPSITNANDTLLLANTNQGSATLSTTSTPPIIDGTTYYLGVQNTNSFPVSYGIEVDFHFVLSGPSTNTSPVSIIHTNISGTNGFLLIWYAPSNDLFEVQWTPVLKTNTWNTFTNPLPVTFDTTYAFVNPTNTRFEFFDDGSQTGGFGTNRFYQVILLNGASGATVLSNGVPQTNGIPAGATAFYQISVPTNAVAATNSLLSTIGGNLNIWFSTNSPPTITNLNDFLLITNAPSGSFVLSTNGSPQLNGGTIYYLGVQNTNAGPVVYGLAVNFDLATNGSPPVPVPISSITHTNISGTNGFLLVWFAPSNDLFQVQWITNLAGTNWGTFTNPPVVAYDPTYPFVNATNTKFDFFDDGSQTGGFGPWRFYRLLLANSSGGPSVIALVNGVPLNFSTVAGATNYFSFAVTQTNAAVLFELYNLTGNGILNLQRSSLPVTPPYFSNSAGPGTNYQQIVLRTNGGLPNINASSWFLGVPNQTAGSVSYTIRAVLPTNGILISGLPINTLVSRTNGTNLQLAWSPTVSGETYEVLTNTNAATTNWVMFTNIIASGTSINFTDPTPIGSMPTLFFDVVQIP